MEHDTISPEDAERTRRTDIRALVRTAGLPAETADDLIDSGADLTRAKAEVFDAVQARARTAPIIRVHGTHGDPAALTRRQSDALAVRMAGGEVAADVRPHMGESMLDMARSALARAGISPRGMSADETFTRAAHGTSDFPLIVSNAMNKVAAQAYQVAESPLKALCRQRTLPNFKESTSVRLGQMGRLEPLGEDGEITHTSRAEAGESFRLHTYARALNVTREILVNDDLALLGDTVAAFGQAAAQTEAEILVDLLTGNPVLSDGTPVFHASRGNVAVASLPLGGTQPVVALDIARRHLRTVKGLDGKTIIAATPRFLVVGPEAETAAEKVLSEVQAATVADVNPWASKLKLLVEPRITDERWFLFADPAQLPCLQYGYLASAQGVQVQQSEAWDTLGMKYRAFLDFGAGWNDWRGAYTSAGTGA